MMMATQEAMVGRAMTGYWDLCPEAGPKSRPNAAFSEDPPTLEVLAINTDQHVLQKL